MSKGVLKKLLAEQQKIIENTFSHPSKCLGREAKFLWG